MKKFFKYFGITVASLVALVIIGAIGATLWLTPSRLGSIASEQASKHLDAAVKIDRIEYTLWSSFPNLKVKIDSVCIDSRALAKLPAGIKAGLPADASFLASVSSVEGSINVVKALRKQIALGDITVSHPRVNIVAVNDTLGNFMILPKHLKTPEIEKLSLGKVEIVGPAVLTATYLPAKATATVDLTRLSLDGSMETDTYALAVSARLVGGIDGISLPVPIEISANGNMCVAPKSDSLKINGLNLSVGPLRVAADAVAKFAPEPVVEALDVTFSSGNLLDILALLPEALKEKYQMPIDMAREDVRSLPLQLTASLNAPYRIASKELPDASARIEIPDANLCIKVPAVKPLTVRNLHLLAHARINPADSSANKLTLDTCSFTAAGCAEVGLRAEVSKLLSEAPGIVADLTAAANLETVEKAFLPSEKMKVKGTLTSSTHVECTLAGLTAGTVKHITANTGLHAPLLVVKDGATKLSAMVKGLDLKGNVSGNMNGTSTKATLALTAQDAYIHSGLDGAALEKIALAMSVRPRTVPYETNSGWSAPSTHADAVLQQKAAHTPVYLTASLPEMAGMALSMADVDASLKIGQCKVDARAYPGNNRISNVYVSTNLDSLTIKSLNIGSGNTVADITGEVLNLRPFLLSGSPVPLRFDLDAHFNDVDINALSGAYYRGQEALTGVKPDYNVPAGGAMTAADSLCILLPRNLEANMRLHSDRAEYMNFSFAPLQTEITMHDGVATLRNLEIGTPFCHALVDWTYSTADMNNIFMQLHLGVDDFDFQELLHTYPGLAEKAPEMDWVGGSVSVTAEGRFLMFPNMFVNTPSLTADFHVTGDSLNLAREDEKLRRITHLMMLKGDGPLAINGIDVHGSLHDNFLQLDPFTLKVGGYQVLLGGANNLQGQMYYHAGLKHSPFHLPFGVNIVGYYRHPEIRFGGTDIKDGRERKLSADLNSDVHFNVMRTLRQGWLQFIAMAAKYDSENTRQQLSDAE